MFTFKILLALSFLLFCLCFLIAEVQKEAGGDAILRASLRNAGADKDTVPAYASGAPGGVKYFDMIGVPPYNKPASKEDNSHGRPD